MRRTMEIVKCLIRLHNKIRNKNIELLMYYNEEEEEEEGKKKEKNNQSTFSSFLRIEGSLFYYREYAGIR
jgi:hypothetical protein